MERNAPRARGGDRAKSNGKPGSRPRPSMPSKRKSPRARAPAFVFDCLMGSLSVLWDRDGPAARDVDLVIHELYQLPVRRLLLFRSVLSPPIPVLCRRCRTTLPAHYGFLSIIFSCRI